ncbi:hypothetical protein MMPV_003517 [Pyropia vietnamensis]
MAPDPDLAPSPHLDDALHKLVAVLQGAHAAAPPAVLAAASRSLAAAGQGGVLASRASDVRGVAQRAEAELERAYADIILERLTGLNGKGGQGKEGDGADGKVPADAWPQGAPPAAVSALAAAARPFPYVDHYVRLVAAEAASLSAVVSHRRRGPQDDGRSGLRLAFCGSGPLPLTGCLLAAADAAASVTLIDVDPQAVAVSKRLLDQWVAAGGLRPGVVTVLHADATQMTFSAVSPGTSTAAGSTSSAGVALTIAADVVFVAALLPTAAKTAIATRLAATAAAMPPGTPSPIMAVRTAHGLTADLTYEASERATLSALLPFVGVVVPRTHQTSPPGVASGHSDDGSCDSEGGVRGEVPEEVLGWFPAEVLNSMELYGQGVRGVEALRAAAREALAGLF